MREIGYIYRIKIMIWDMKEYDRLKKQTWANSVDISIDLSFCGLPRECYCWRNKLFMPLAYSKDGREILLGTGKYASIILQYDLHTRNVKRLEICGLPNDWNWASYSDGYVAIPWVPSLVSPSSSST